MKLSTRARYGLKVCFLLGVGGSQSLPQLSKRTGHSGKYLEQLLSMLKKGGVIQAERGANGGYSLSRDPSQINIAEILDALGDGFDMDACNDACQDAYCPNKRIFLTLSDTINRTLSAITLKDMIDDYRCV